MSRFSDLLRLLVDVMAGPSPGFEGIKTVAGPMGRCVHPASCLSSVVYLFRRSVEDLELICRTAFGVRGNDHNVMPIPFREVQLPKKLRVGYFTAGQSNFDILPSKSSRVYRWVCKGFPCLSTGSPRDCRRAQTTRA